jgi:NADH-quinone oxidoreductase subunit M
VVLAAIYLLKMIQLTIFGPITKEENRALKDLSGRELAALIPLCVFMVWIGVAPDTFLKPSRRALESVLSDYKQRIAEPNVAQATLRPAATPQVSSTTEAGR